MKQVGDMPQPPLIHSVSYGNDEKQQTSTAYMNSVNVQFQKAGTRGLSVLFASGDQGVWGRSGTLGARRFHPDFPGGSPYITVVGGTDFAKTGVIGDETAWSDGGGGFSDTFNVPSYQQQAVSHYLASGSSLEKFPPASYFNSTGRGYPDVAALAGVKNPYCVAAGGAMSGVQDAVLPGAPSAEFQHDLLLSSRFDLQAVLLRAPRKRDSGTASTALTTLKNGVGIGILALPYGLPYDLQVWGDPEYPMAIEDLGFSNMVASDAYYAARSGNGSVRVDVYASGGEVRIHHYYY